MNAKSLIEEKNLSELGEAKEERIKLRLEATELKRRLLEIKTRQQELKNTEKKKTMKESSPAPLKERKEIRKEFCLNNYNNKGDSPKTKKENPQEQTFVPPTLDEVQAYMDEIGENRFSALRFWNYYEAKGWVLGKAKMRFWKRVLDNWSNTENDRSKRRRGAHASASQKNIVTFNPYKPVDTTGAVSRDEYERMLKEGKI